ncbi:hypothetical protein RA2_04188 [Roseovarius sp. A-2]|nr:hypothetical protein [Roseovarius sp. A-2]GAW37113.1 hypothetical protein RA2_04188 [Roseovarius sp. A-2]
MAYTLQLLHANDLEGGVEALENAPNFAAIVDALEGHCQLIFTRPNEA